MVRAVTLVAAVAAVWGPMQLKSADCPPQRPIVRAAMSIDCGGDNRSPALVWSNAPADAKSFAVVMHDADAPIAGGFYHWVAYNLPAGSNSLAAGARLSPSQAGINSLGKAAYYGPCPPPGPAHHYTIKLYALDLGAIAAGSPLTAAQLEERIKSHVLATAVLPTTASSP